MAKSDEKKQKKNKQDKKGKKKDDKPSSKQTKNKVAQVKASRLADLKCVPCRGGVPPLGPEAIKKLIGQIRGWNAPKGHHLEKSFKFDDFAAALDFTIEVGELAEVESHHPDIYLSWGKVEIKIWTHKIDGLTESDFILAAKIDQLT